MKRRVMSNISPKVAKELGFKEEEEPKKEKPVNCWALNNANKKIKKLNDDNERLTKELAEKEAMLEEMRKNAELNNSQVLCKD
jgi:hypothetical protein